MPDVPPRAEVAAIRMKRAVARRRLGQPPGGLGDLLGRMDDLPPA